MNYFDHDTLDDDGDGLNFARGLVTVLAIYGAVLTAVAIWICVGG